MIASLTQTVFIFQTNYTTSLSYPDCLKASPAGHAPPAQHQTILLSPKLLVLLFIEQLPKSNANPCSLLINFSNSLSGMLLRTKTAHVN